MNFHLSSHAYIIKTPTPKFTEGASYGIEEVQHSVTNWGHKSILIFRFQFHLLLSGFLKIVNFSSIGKRYKTLMASTTQPHPSFTSRPFSSTIHGKLPERTAPAPFGASSTRETARLERERQERERAQREAAQAGPSNPLASITDEQREEINEAVCPELSQS